MQGTRIRLLVGGLLLVAANGSVHAEALQPDPAWQQGQLNNGFSWQILDTPQRPSDRVELRLMVNTGSLVESAQQIGFAHLLPRYCDYAQREFYPSRSYSRCGNRAWTVNGPLPPAISSYDFTIYNLSLPNNRPDLLKEALAWLADTTGKLAIDEPTVEAVMNSNMDPIGIFPPESQRQLVALSPERLNATGTRSGPTGQAAGQYRTAAEILPGNGIPRDVMTLYVVGKVDSRSLTEQINKAFSPLQGKARSAGNHANSDSTAAAAGQSDQRSGEAGYAVDHVGYAMASDSRFAKPEPLLAQ
ncbi:Uncharacterised protein [Serratia fonticola]|uniref:Peptidase M16 N-terminal domain-containing protein n=1 Tax=Serratia fonticola TaxID=47917 RepID=A0A4U9VTD5_SERFO|nr:Uncharacterised protein [Serratia fonticola]